MGVGTETVHRLCAGLPDDQRSVLLLRILADLTVEQVAQAMGRSVALGQGAPAPRAPDPPRPRSRPSAKKSVRDRAPLRASPAMTGVR